MKMKIFTEFKICRIILPLKLLSNDFPDKYNFQKHTILLYTQMTLVYFILLKTVIITLGNKIFATLKWKSALEYIWGADFKSAFVLC